MEGGRIRVAGKYLIQKKLGAGSFGDVFLGTSSDPTEEVAIKLEDVHSKFPQVLAEAKIMSGLKGTGIPKVHWYGTEGSFNIMVLEVLGKSLEDVFQMNQSKFSIKTVVMIADQIFQRIETVHNQSYLHRDIKPDNFLFGVGKKANIVHIIDFGLSKKYRDASTKQHIKFSDKRALTGTARYASINSHMGNEQSRRDDIEAITYLIIYLFSGKLPWQGISFHNKAEKYRMIMNVKLNTTPETLCRNSPPEIVTILSYARSLRFEETPDYSFLRSNIQKIAERETFAIDNIFDWNSHQSSPKQKKTKKKKKKSPKINEERKAVPIKEDEVSTCIATTRWPEFNDREKIFSKINLEKAERAQENSNLEVKENSKHNDEHLCNVF
jgi:casein kinase 1